MGNLETGEKGAVGMIAEPQTGLDGVLVILDKSGSYT
jgi:hypothetical protein